MFPGIVQEGRSAFETLSSQTMNLKEVAFAGALLDETALFLHSELRPTAGGPAECHSKTPPNRAPSSRTKRY
jgi:hypothetical protein